MKKKFIILPVLLFALTGCIQFSNTPGPSNPSQETSQEEPKEYIESIEIPNVENYSVATLSFRNASTGDILNIQDTELDNTLKLEKNDPKKVYSSIENSNKLSFGQGFVRFQTLTLNFSNAISYEYATFSLRAYNRRIHNHETDTDDIKTLDGAFRINNEGYIKVNSTYDPEKDLVPLTPCTYRVSAKQIKLEIFGAAYLENIKFYYPKTSESEESSSQAIEDVEIESLTISESLKEKGNIKFDIYKNSGDKGNYPNPMDVTKVHPVDETSSNTPGYTMGEDINVDVLNCDINRVLDQNHPIESYKNVALSEKSLLVQEITLNISSTINYEYVELQLTPWFKRDIIEGAPSKYIFDSEDSGVMLNQDKEEGREFIKLNKLESPSLDKYPTLQSCVYKTNSHQLKIQAHGTRIKLYGIIFY